MELTKSEASMCTFEETEGQQSVSDSNGDFVFSFTTTITTKQLRAHYLVETLLISQRQV